MRVRLTRKYAECIDGVDLSGRQVGEIMDIPNRDAALLVAEGWASLIESDSSLTIVDSSQTGSGSGVDEPLPAVDVRKLETTQPFLRYKGRGRSRATAVRKQAT
jgi:hypothetical protein